MNKCTSPGPTLKFFQQYNYSWLGL